MKTELGKMKFDLYESKNDAYVNGREDGFHIGFRWGVIIGVVLICIITVTIFKITNSF